MNSESPEQLRKYAQIWNLLKATGAASIVAPKPFHRRIIRAVIKEKYQDLGWKLILDDAGTTMPKLRYRIKDSMITFRLESNSILETL